MVVVVVGFSGGGAGFVINSGTLDCSVGFGLLARAGLRISRFDRRMHRSMDPA
jgi:hypothetical protein